MTWTDCFFIPCSFAFIFCLPSCLTCVCVWSSSSLASINRIKSNQITVELAYQTRLRHRSCRSSLRLAVGNIAHHHCSFLSPNRFLPPSFPFPPYHVEPNFTYRPFAIRIMAGETQRFVSLHPPLDERENERGEQIERGS